VTKCLVCATELQKAVTRRSSDKPESPKSLTDYLRKELPKTDLRSAKVTCPQCALELQGGEAKCPRCGIPLKSELDMLECPECGALTPEGAKACPNCGIGFDDQEEEIQVPVPPPLVEEEPVGQLGPKVLPQAPPAPTPDVITTMPAGVSTPSDHGFVNGRGAVNGTGLINGSGLVNGTGITNGTKGEGGRTPPPGRRMSFLSRWQFLAVVVAIVVVISTFVFLSYSAPSEGIVIDGDFGDWSHESKLGIYSLAGSAPVDIDEWAIQVKDQQLFLYFRVQGVLMGSTNVDSFYLFVDADNSPSTGYNVSGIGADYLLVMSGWNGSVRAASLDRYASTTDQFDWNSWSGVSSISASSGATQLEAMASMPVSLDGNAKFVLLSQDYLYRNSLSYAVPTIGGTLVVEQSMGSDVQTDGTVAQASGVTMVRLVFTCQRAGGTVQGFVPLVSGADLSSSFEEFELKPGDEHIVDLQLNTLLSTEGSLVSASVVPSGITSTFSSVQVLGLPVRAYIASAPSEIIIDGAFGDWTGRTSMDADSTIIGNVNININSIGAVNTTSSSSFYVSVVGEMCSGSNVPIIVSKPSGFGGGGGIVILPRKTGEDILRVYIDSDMSTATGFPVSLVSKTIGADFKIEITGLFGEITSKSLMNYSGDSWEPVSGAVVSAANDAQRLELQVLSESVSGKESIDYAVETTDWMGRADFATSVPQGTRSWIIDGTTTSSAATAMSYQRKIFYDGTNFWSFYWDGTNTVCKYSADSGVTWTAGGTVFKTTGVNEASIWWDSANSVVYVVGDISAASTDVCLQKGTVSPATHTIDWAPGNDNTLTVSANALGGKNAFISRDASGYIWVMSSNLTGTTPSRYDLSAFRSSATNDITGWLFGGNMLDTDDTQPTLKGSVMPAGTGTDVWAVYGYGGNVAARRLTSGVWSAQTTIYAIGAANPGNTDTAPPCGVVDSSGVVHVVYGNGHDQAGVSKPWIYYVYNTGSGWAVPYRLESTNNPIGNLCPTVSVDTSTGVVYAFWLQTDSNAVGITVMAKKNVSGTWTAMGLPPQTADAKQYLNSIYSASGEQFICWQWTQNTTNPIHVIFEKIPEFQTVVLPVLFLTLVVVVGMQRRKGRSGKDE
jgi:hypothetical protein